MKLLGVDAVTRRLTIPRASPYVLRLRIRTPDGQYLDLTGRDFALTLFDPATGLAAPSAAAEPGTDATRVVMSLPGSVSAELYGQYGLQWEVAELLATGKAQLLTGKLLIASAATSGEGDGDYPAGGSGDELEWSPDTEAIIVAAIGVPGQRGAAATITLGTVETGEPGQPGEVTEGGTSSARVFGFKLPVAELPTFGIGEVESTDPGGEGAVALTGAYPDLALNFTLPRGPQGLSAAQQLFDDEVIDAPTVEAMDERFSREPHGVNLIQYPKVFLGYYKAGPYLFRPEIIRRAAFTVEGGAGTIEVTAYIDDDPVLGPVVVGTTPTVVTELALTIPAGARLIVELDNMIGTVTHLEALFETVPA